MFHIINLIPFKRPYGAFKFLGKMTITPIFKVKICSSKPLNSNLFKISDINWRIFFFIFSYKIIYPHVFLDVTGITLITLCLISFQCLAFVVGF